MPSDFPRIVFMGTPEFAVASLAALLGVGYTVAGVVTAPDKPSGRGMKLSESAVKQFAAAQGLTLLQPPNLKAPEFLESLRALRADLQVVVAFRMLPEAVWNMPPMGTINVHGSLLPDYRGAAPINRAIMNGETQTGVTTFKMQQAIDTGNLLLTRALPIGPAETAGELHDRMKEAGAALLVETIRGLVDGTLKEKPQPAGGSSKTAPKIFTEDGIIHWDRPLKTIYDQIRGLSPFPAAFTQYHGRILKIFRAHPEPGTHGLAPGTAVTDGRGWLKFAAPDGFLVVDELQYEGRKRMAIADFLRGFRPPESSLSPAP